MVFQTLHCWRLHGWQGMFVLLQTLLSAALAAAVDKDVADIAEPFVRGAITHLALLYASGHALSQQELGVCGSWTSGAPAATAAAAAAAVAGAEPPPPRELNMCVAFRGLMAVLTDKDERRIAAGVKAVDTFVAALLAAADVKREAGAASGDAVKTEADQSGTASGDAMDAEDTKADVAAGAPEASALADEGADENARPPGDPGIPPPLRSTTSGVGGSGSGGAKDADAKSRPPLAPLVPPSVQANLPPVLDDLVSHVLHACHGDAWGRRIGGIGGLKVITKRLPRAYLKPWAPQLVAGIAQVRSCHHFAVCNIHAASPRMAFSVSFHQ